MSAHGHHHHVTNLTLNNILLIPTDVHHFIDGSWKLFAAGISMILQHTKCSVTKGLLQVPPSQLHSHQHQHALHRRLIDRIRWWISIELPHLLILMKDDINRKRHIFFMHKWWTKRGKNSQGNFSFTPIAPMSICNRGRERSKV